MSNKHLYKVPDYYDSFSCKGPECRNTCCNGWGITFSLSEYFHLLGLSCSPELRRRLDCAFHIAETPTELRYAVLSPSYDGDCKLHGADGLCALHAECGESVLSSTCRYYPRSAKAHYANECSCANSCEAVLEQLLMRRAPITFHELELEFQLPEPETESDAVTRRLYNPIRELSIAIIQNREFSLPQRLLTLCRTLEPVSEAFEAGDEARVLELLRRGVNELPLPAPDLESSLGVQELLLTYFERNSHSLERYSAYAHELLGEGDRCAAARDHFERLFPDWQIMFEQMLVNHIFYECFPFSPREETIADECAALLAVYALLRLMAVGYMMGRSDIKDLVDVSAATFRLIEHSRFDHNALVLLHRAGYLNRSKLSQLVLT